MKPTWSIGARFPFIAGLKRKKEYERKKCHPSFGGVLIPVTILICSMEQEESVFTSKGGETCVPSQC